MSQCKEHHWPNEEGPCPYCKISGLEILVGLLSMEVSDLMGLYLAHFPEFVGWPDHATIGVGVIEKMGEKDSTKYLDSLKDRAKALLAAKVEP